jgi:hypothetical protein
MSSCHSRLCKADHAYLVYLMLQRQLSHLNGRKLDRRQVETYYVFFFLSGFDLSYAANVIVLVILCDLCLFPVQFRYIFVYIPKVESRVQFADRCAPWKIVIGAENLV